MIVMDAHYTAQSGADFMKRNAFACSDWSADDLAHLPPRQWLYGRHYIRGSIGATIANGGTGKTSLLIAEAVAMATGRNLLGVPVIERVRVLYWNGEEPPEEIKRRVYAVCQHYQIEPAELGGWLFTASGLEKPIALTNANHNGLVQLKHFLADDAIDVVIIDPFVASHRVGENDNMAIDAIAKQWAALANEQQVSIDLVHHTRKPPFGGEADNTIHDARGATALVDAARTVRVLNVMTEAEGRQGERRTASQLFPHRCRQGQLCAGRGRDLAAYRG
jgi:RecA-family ATPase